MIIFFFKHFSTLEDFLQSDFSISEYTTNLHHVKGKQNVVADALSRIILPLINTASMIAAIEWANFATLIADENNDPDIQHIRPHSPPS